MNLPNQTCECGSGNKQKKCHPFGAPVYGPMPAPRKPLTPEQITDNRRKDLEVKTMLAGMICMFG
jgi:hypothetical protein